MIPLFEYAELKGKISSNIGRLAKVKQAGRCPMVLHKRQPFNKVFRCFILAQVVAGASLKVGYKMSLYAVMKTDEIGTLNSIIQDPCRTGLAAKGPVFGKLVNI